MKDNFSSSTLVDGRGRSVSYLRLSITDRCNFRCLYCKGENNSYIPHDDILRYEELIRFVRISHDLGIRKIRLTGGEPFVRKGCLPFLKTLREKLPDTHLCITTNGSLIEPYLEELRHLRLDSVNLSLDTLNSSDFYRITGKPLFSTVMKNLEKMLSLGLNVKINAVILKDITDRQINDFLNLLTEYPIDLRFIEFMPMGHHTLWNQSNFLSAAQLKSLFSSQVNLIPIASSNNLAGPAQLYKITGKPGRLGFITPISSHFCGTCNRIRLTSNGKLRRCLFEDKEISLSSALRSRKINDGQIKKILRHALSDKPLGADILAARHSLAVAQKQMNGIGG